MKPKFSETVGIWDTWYGGVAWTMQNVVAMLDDSHQECILEGMPFMIFHPWPEQARQWLLI